LEGRDQIAREAAILIVGFAFGHSLLAFDLMMSLAHKWVSNLFGAFYFKGSFLAALMALAVLAIALRRRMGLAQLISAKQLHDLVKLCFGFTVFWAYLMWAQFLVIWYGNLPEETYFILHRHAHRLPLADEAVEDEIGLLRQGPVPDHQELRPHEVAPEHREPEAQLPEVVQLPGRDQVAQAHRPAEQDRAHCERHQGREEAPHKVERAEQVAHPFVRERHHQVEREQAVPEGERDDEDGGLAADAVTVFQAVGRAPLGGCPAPTGRPPPRRARRPRPGPRRPGPGRPAPAERVRRGRQPERRSPAASAAGLRLQRTDVVHEVPAVGPAHLVAVVGHQA